MAAKEPETAADRQRRLARALRANLHRRKAQARARAEAPGDAPEPRAGNEGDAPDDGA
jgi:hypothetical protein